MSVTKSPAWCTRCIESKRGPCDDHRGPDGQPQEYTGRDVYVPGAWVLSVVGKRYTTGDWCNKNGGKPIVYECFGYDPRHGFWMRQPEDHTKLTNVSTRAIGTNFIEVRMVPFAWELLGKIVEHGRVPAPEDVGGNLFASLTRLEQIGYVQNGIVTERGTAALKERGA